MKTRILFLLLSFFALTAHAQNDPKTIYAGSANSGTIYNGVLGAKGALIAPEGTHAPKYANAPYVGRIQYNIETGFFEGNDGTKWVEFSLSQNLKDSLKLMAQKFPLKADLVNGKVPLTQINDALLGAVNYQGTYNAATNTPALPNATSSKGKYWVVNIAGTQQGENFKVRDWVISNGVIWGRLPNAADVDITPTIGSNNAVSSDGVAFALLQKANDNAVLHKAGSETITGVKIFDVSPKVPNGTTAYDPVNVLQWQEKANDVDVVKVTGTQVVGGSKTFSEYLVTPGGIISDTGTANYITNLNIPEGTEATHAVRKSQLDLKANTSSTLTVASGLIGTGANLNLYNITGLYICQSNAVASSGLNFPAGGITAGKLEVVKYDGSNTFYQTYHTYSDVNKMFYRSCYNGTFSDWKTVANESELSGKANLIGNNAFTGNNNYNGVLAIKNPTTQTDQWNFSVGTTGLLNLINLYQTAGAAFSMDYLGNATFGGKVKVANPVAALDAVNLQTMNSALVQKVDWTDADNKFAPIIGDVVFKGNKAFESALTLSTAGSLPNHAVNVGQMQAYVTTVMNVINASATLDFSATEIQNNNDLTVSVPGAALGDIVVLGVPAESIRFNSLFCAWVSAPNVVTVRYNLYGSASQNPASGVFKIRVMK